MEIIHENFIKLYSKKEQSLLRESLFRHLDGYVTAPIAYALYKQGIIHYILLHKQVTLKELTSHYNANDGYLNVALRVLSSQGWLIQEIDNKRDDVNFKLTNLGKIAFENFSHYKTSVKYLKYCEMSDFDDFIKNTSYLMDNLFEEYKELLNIISIKDTEANDALEQILRHIEGVIVAPIVAQVGMHNLINDFLADEAYFKWSRILAYLGWLTFDNGKYELTSKGLFYFDRASAYGVTVSYSSTLNKINELIFGNPKILKVIGNDNNEIHVDRKMNVWGSGGAHSNYFKVVDEIIIDIFNKPIWEQPKGILDFGCGDGTFLCHLHDVIMKKTIRGKYIDDFPLHIIGVDYNNEALNKTKDNFKKTNMLSNVIWGDIGDPDSLYNDLHEKHNIDLKDLLNVRSFLDHNRIWEEPNSNYFHVSSSTGAFAFNGKRLKNCSVENSLKEHLIKWKPYIKKHGLLIIELHTIAPDLVAKNIGRTGATAYDAIHGFSDQYILELDIFLKILSEIGLYPERKFTKKFPDSDLATVSINLISNKY